MHLPQSRAINMRVYLRGRDVGVAQHFLDDAKVCAAHQQVRCKAMPKHVGIDLKPGALRVVVHDLPHAHSFKWATSI